ncbi:MAG: hypothetical protein ABSH16_02235 [Sedimentisphaerales bacterium]
MVVLGHDIYLDVKLLSFDQSVVMQKSSIILEQEKQLPIETDSFFIEKEKAPCGGSIEISLKTGRSTINTRTLRSELKKIPVEKWYSYIGEFYNNGQEAIRHIPVVGKVLEKIAPDAYQKIKIHYHVSVTEEKQVSYWIHINRLDNITLQVFQGNVLLT